MLNDKDAKRLLALWALLDSDKEGERDAARRKLEDFLKKHGLKWADLWGLVQAKPAEPEWHDAEDVPDHDDPDAPPLIPTLIATLEKYLYVKPHEVVAVALWAAHAHVFETFSHSPKLAMLSPVGGCGKTTVLRLLKELTPRGVLTPSVSAAAVYEMIDTDKATVLLDQGEDINFAAMTTLRAVLNSTHERGQEVRRSGRTFKTFAPVAIASVGILPQTLTQRCVAIKMHRKPRGTAIKDFIAEDAKELQPLFRRLQIWAKNIGPSLQYNPRLPSELHNRMADNWRPLISVADSLDFGNEARNAAKEFARGHNEEDAGVMLLKDIRAAFELHKRGRLFTKTILATLNADYNAPWGAWCGPKGNQLPRPLTVHGLAGLLKPFGIRPRTLWEHGRTFSAKGYTRSDFRTAWAQYCPEAVTPSQPKDTNWLGRIKSGTTAEWPGATPEWP